MSEKISLDSSGTLVILVLAYFITTAVKSNKITAFLFLGIKAK